MPMIDLLDADGARRAQPALIALLRDVVDDGGSVGFLPPLSADEAREYWESVAVAVKGGGAPSSSIWRSARTAATAPS